MITIEEICKRIEEGSESFEKNPEKEYNFRPERPPFEVKVLDFKIPANLSDNGAAITRKRLAKVLTFIEIINKKRYKDGVTVLSIATNNKQINQFWKSSATVGDQFRWLCEMGLMQLYENEKRFNAKGKHENRSFRYLYFVENERKLIDYCEKEGIKPFKINTIDEKKKKKTINKINQFSNQLDFDVKDVWINNDLCLTKPDGMTRPEFEEYLCECLRVNYPSIRLIEHKVREMNERFYVNEPEFAIRFKPNFTWESGGLPIVVGIGLRATNSFSNKKNNNSDERTNVLKEHNLKLYKDVRSSVPRLTLSINSGTWIDESIDIYELINNIFEPGSVLTSERRDAIKELHMSNYFDKGSKAFIGKNVWFRMRKNGAAKGDVDDLMFALRNAIVTAEGGITYGSQIFYAESCIYLMTLYDLLWAGIKTWIVYDAFYCMDFAESEMFEKMVSDQLKFNFEDWLSKENISWWKKNVGG